MGLTGVAICRSCRPSRYVFTDCHPSVLQRLKANVRLNGLTEGTTPGVSVEELDWTEATEERLEQIGADVVIAAGCSGIFFFLQITQTFLGVCAASIQTCLHRCHPGL